MSEECKHKNKKELTKGISYTLPNAPSKIEECIDCGEIIAYDVISGSIDVRKNGKIYTYNFKNGKMVK